MASQRIVFLDLEETCIDTWHEARLLPNNLRKIRSILRPDDVLGLMSWAVHNSQDLEEFNNVMRQPIESRIGHAFDSSLVLDMHGFHRLLVAHTGKRLERSDMFDLFDKQQILMLLARSRLWSNTEIVLIDDTVDPDMHLAIPRNGNSVLMLNIHTSVFDSVQTQTFLNTTSCATS